MSLIVNVSMLFFLDKFVLKDCCCFPFCHSFSCSGDHSVIHWIRIPDLKHWPFTARESWVQALLPIKSVCEKAFSTKLQWIYCCHTQNPNYLWLMMATHDSQCCEVSTVLQVYHAVEAPSSDKFLSVYEPE